MKYFFTLFFLFLACYAFSQENLSAKEIQLFKQKVEEKATSITSIESDFTQTKHLAILSSDAVSKGKLFFKSPDNVRWEYTSPKRYVVIFMDGKLFVNENGKKSDYNLASNKLFQSLNGMIVNSVTGNMFNENEFDITYFKNSEGVKVHYIPKHKKLKRYLSSFDVFFNETVDVISLQLNESNTDYTKIEFLNKRYNSPIPSGTFEH